LYYQTDGTLTLNLNNTYLLGAFDSSQIHKYSIKKLTPSNIPSIKIGLTKDYLSITNTQKFPYIDDYIIIIDAEEIVKYYVNNNTLPDTSLATMTIKDNPLYITESWKVGNKYEEYEYVTNTLFDKTNPGFKIRVTPDNYVNRKERYVKENEKFNIELPFVDSYMPMLNTSKIKHKNDYYLSHTDEFFKECNEYLNINYDDLKIYTNIDLTGLTEWYFKYEYIANKVNEAGNLSIETTLSDGRINGNTFSGNNNQIYYVKWKEDSKYHV